ncbi:hypothetical protein LTR17_025236 [Elasticomyces elasticus]|nr:hypothetical protein LTR17_025236 [Elasticomyces elasticus]
MWRNSRAAHPAPQHATLWQPRNTCAIGVAVPTTTTAPSSCEELLVEIPSHEGAGHRAVQCDPGVKNGKCPASSSPNTTFVDSLREDGRRTAAGNCKGSGGSAVDYASVMSEEECVCSPFDVDDVEGEAEETARQETYVIMDGEDANDYTDGPARFVLAHDGVKTCVAVLLTLELSCWVQRTVQAQRDYIYAVALFQKVDRQKSVLIYQVESKLEHHFACLAYLNSTQGDPTEGETEVLEQEIGILQKLLTNTKIELANLQLQMDTDTEHRDESLGELTTIIEEPFIHARLVEDYVAQSLPEVHELDLDEECRKLRNGSGDEDQEANPPIPLNSVNTPGGSSHGDISPTAERQHRMRMSSRYTQARSELNRAYDDFNTKKQVRAAEWEASITATEDRDEWYDEPDVFRLGWPTRIQAMTRAIFEAQQELEDARLALAPAGIKKFEEWEEVYFDEMVAVKRSDFEKKLAAIVSRMGPAMAFGFDEMIRPNGSKPPETNGEMLYRRRGRSV